MSHPAQMDRKWRLLRGTTLKPWHCICREDWKAKWNNKNQLYRAFPPTVYAFISWPPDTQFPNKLFFFNTVKKKSNVFLSKLLSSGYNCTTWPAQHTKILCLDYLYNEFLYHTLWLQFLFFNAMYHQLTSMNLHLHAILLILYMRRAPSGVQENVKMYPT